MKDRLRLCLLIPGTVLPLLLLLAGCGDSRPERTTSAETPVAMNSSPSSPVEAPTPEATSPAVVSPAKPTEAAEPLPAGVLYRDDFTDIASGWPQEQEFANYYLGYHEPEYFHVEVHASHDRALVALPDHQFGDFTAESEIFVSISNTDTNGDFIYGLAVRRTGNLYYAFVISPQTQSWQVLKSDASGITVLDQGDEPSIQGLERSDTLRIDAAGSSFTFHVNGRVVSQITDAEYEGGEIALYTETFDSSRAHIHFDTLTVQKLAESPAASADQPSAAFYEDDFTDIASGWPQEQEFANYYLGYHEPEYYHVEVHASHDRALVALPDHQFGDFTAESEIFVSISNTDTNGDFIYGLAVRRTGNLYYAFVISPQTQSWQVLKSDASGITTLDQGDDPSIQGLERSDSLRIDAIGPNMAFHINGHVVAQLSDPDYAEGEISLYTETFDSQRAHIHFDSLIIGPAESPPTPTPPPVPPTDTPVPVPAGMVMVPEGSFLMGSPDGPSNERPEHEVSLSAYFIDRLEVSNAQYRECVAAGGCSQAMLASGYTRPGYRDNSEYDEYPVMGVTWAQAAAYCTWAGKRLPTEAEWEYAAGGPDNYTWPWGNEFDPQLSAASAPDTQPVASYPEGASPFGILNMAGNVTEWVQDVYSDTFYANSPVENPVGTGEGNDRIFRGGSFANVDGGAYSTSRRYVKPAAFADVDVGFRCAQDVPSGG